MKIKILLAFVAIFALSSFSNASPWVLDSVHTDIAQNAHHQYLGIDYTDTFNGGSASVTDGYSIWQNLNVSSNQGGYVRGADWYSSTYFRNANSYFDFKWNIPHQYPPINLTGVIAVYAETSAHGYDTYGGSTWTSELAVPGIDDHSFPYNFGGPVSYSFNNGSSQWSGSFSGAVSTYDGTYYHCHVSFPPPATTPNIADIKLSTYISGGATYGFLSEDVNTYIKVYVLSHS